MHDGTRPTPDGQFFGRHMAFNNNEVAKLYWKHNASTSSRIASGRSILRSTTETNRASASLPSERLAVPRLLYFP